VVPLPEHAVRTTAVAAQGVDVRIACIVSIAEQGSCLLARDSGYYVLGELHAIACRSVRVTGTAVHTREETSVHGHARSFRALFVASP
jgi:hypothetical protein